MRDHTDSQRAGGAKLNMNLEAAAKYLDSESQFEHLRFSGSFASRFRSSSASADIGSAQNYPRRNLSDVSVEPHQKAVIESEMRSKALENVPNFVRNANRSKPVNKVSFRDCLKQITLRTSAVTSIIFGDFTLTSWMYHNILFYTPVPTLTSACDVTSALFCILPVDSGSAFGPCWRVAAIITEGYAI